MLRSHRVIDDDHGRFWRYGRLYLSRYPDDTGEHNATWECGWQWSLFRPTLGFGFSVGTGTGQDDEDFSASVRLGRFGSFYFNADRLPPFCWLARLAGDEFPRDRELEVGAHDGLISWRLWAATMGYHTGPKWRDSTFNWKRWVGWEPSHVGWETLDTVRTVIPMPEGNYDATVNLIRGTWRRRRLFRFTPKVHRFRAEIIPDTPIPVPGKGENSWDCDDDYISESSGPWRTAEEAVAGIIRSVYRDRTRYGNGPEWQPAGRLP